MTGIRDRRWAPDGATDDAWRSLTEGWRELVAALIPVLPNPQSLRTLDFVGPAATISFSVPGVTRPAGIVLVSLYRVDTGATSAVTLSWSYSNGMVTTTSFSGLAATTWRATFLVIGA